MIQLLLKGLVRAMQTVEYVKTVNIANIATVEDLVECVDNLKFPNKIISYNIIEIVL
jgi:hypothetical protein